MKLKWFTPVTPDDMEELGYYGNGWLYDTMLAYVAGLTAAGKPVEFENRHWITILDKDDRK
jgi:hypothetical protein